MKVHVTYLTRRASGAISRKRVEVDAPEIRLGRSTHVEVYLADLRVALEHAQISTTHGGMLVSALGERGLTMASGPVRQIELEIDQNVHVGPYEITRVAAPEGFDAAITIDLVDAETGSLAILESQKGMNLVGSMMSKRTLAWVSFVAVLALFLGFPLATMYGPKSVGSDGQFAKAMLITDAAWSAGEISDPHKTFANDCEACHEQSFVMVRNESCGECHSDTLHHADLEKMAQAAAMQPKAQQIANMPWQKITGDPLRCGSCHKEHNGARGILPTDQASCSTCHENLNAHTKTALLNVSDFADHPQFQIRLVQDPRIDWDKQPRISLAKLDGAKENSGIKFPHDKHMARNDIMNKATNGKPLVCANCHETEPGGGGMVPMQQEIQCGASCHTLNFDEKAPQRRLPHGQPDEVAEIIEDHYARLALTGEASYRGAIEIRRRPGQALTQEERTIALTWARQEAALKIDAIFTKSLCKTCHTVDKDPKARSGFKIVKPKIANTWMPKAWFHHASHDTMECGDCHKADKSKTSEDILIPGVENCKECHGGQEASIAVPSTCIMCHQYHSEDGMEPMMPEVLKKKQEARSRQ